MVCCKETAWRADALKASATQFGFDPTWIADLLQKYGPDVLALAVEAVRNGLSINLVIEIIEKFGPGLLQFIVNWLQSQNSKKLGVVSGESVVVPPSNGPIIPGIDTNVIDIIIEQYLPIIMQQLLANVNWQQLIQAVIQAIVNNINITPLPTPTPTPANK
jgi:hypothetical protein